MLTNITLENFKAFQKLDDLKIKPIIILCGTNSCGKSSILQSILLLKQTLESQDLKQNLLLNGRFVKLGYFQDILFRGDRDTSMSFDLIFDIDSKDDKFQHVYFYIHQMILSNYDMEKEDRYRIKYRFSLKILKEDSALNINYIQPILVEYLSMQVFKICAEEEDEVLQVTLRHSKGDLYVISYKDGKVEKKSELEFKIEFANLFPSSFSFNEELLKSVPNFLGATYQLKELLKIIFYSYTYVGPLRGEPERRYIYEDEVLEIGNKGENAAYLYLTEQNKRIHNHYFYNPSIDSFETLPNQTLHSALQEWFELMKIPNFEAEINNKIIYLNMEASAYDETRVGIADVGFGVSQIFPIILEGLRMEKGGTLMLEQPEIHLHPNLQMQMADYFISLALSGKQVFVETHSDHVINRLVRRIVEDETLNLKDLIGIYFIKPSENGSVYEEINIDDTKGITNWPPDFFDQTANEQMKIMQAGLKKRKNQRVPANGKP